MNCLYKEHSPDAPATHGLYYVATQSGVGVSNQSVECLSVGLCQECVFTCGRNEPRKILKGHLAPRIADCRRRLDLPVTKAGVLKGGIWEETVVIRKL